MDGLISCREGLDEVRRMLTIHRLLAKEQMERAVTLMLECERYAAEHGHVVLELRAAQLKVKRCEVAGEFLGFLEMQYRSRGLSNPMRIATLVVLEDAVNALKRAMVATMEEMRRA